MNHAGVRGADLALWKIHLFAASASETRESIYDSPEVQKRKPLVRIRLKL